MQETVPTQPELRTREDYKAAIDECLAEMRRLREKIDQDQIEIDRLKAETRAVLARLRSD